MTCMVYVESLVNKGFQFYNLKTKEKAQKFVNKINKGQNTLLAKLV